MRHAEYFYAVFLRAVFPRRLVAGTRRREGFPFRLVLVGLALGGAGCKKAPPPPPVVIMAAPSALPSASAVTPDRLGEGALLPSDTVVHGLALPLGMRVRAFHDQGAAADGTVAPELVATYVKERVLSQLVEMEGDHIVFPRARVKNGDETVYRYEIVPQGQLCTLYIRKLSAEAAPEGLTEAERWQRAGLTPNGRLLNEKELD